MPFANLKIPAGLVTEEQKAQMVESVTTMFVGFFGEEARRNTMVLVDEVVDGGWGVGGQVLTRAMLSE